LARWAVIFEDTPAMLLHRKEHGAAHIAYLEANADKILIGGGLRAAADAPFEGGLWIVDAESHGEVVALVVNDPYFNPQHRRFTIQWWGKALDHEVIL